MLMQTHYLMNYNNLASQKVEKGLIILPLLARQLEVLRVFFHETNYVDDSATKKV